MRLERLLEQGIHPSLEVQGIYLGFGHLGVVGNAGASKYQVKQLWEMSLPEKERRVQCCDIVTDWLLWVDRECHEVRLWIQNGQIL